MGRDDEQAQTVDGYAPSFLDLPVGVSGVEEDQRPHEDQCPSVLHVRPVGSSHQREYVKPMVGDRV